MARKLKYILPVLPLLLALVLLLMDDKSISGRPTAVKVSAVVTVTASPSSVMCQKAPMRFGDDFKAQGFTCEKFFRINDHYWEEWYSGDKMIEVYDGAISTITHQHNMSCELPVADDLPDYMVDHAVEVLEQVAQKAGDVSFASDEYGAPVAQVTIEYAGRQLTLSCYELF